MSIVRGLLNLIRFPFFPLWWLSRRLRAPKANWLVVRLRSQVTELPSPMHPLMRYVPQLKKALPTDLLTLRKLIAQVKHDDRIDGILLHIPNLAAGWATCQSLRDAIEDLRSADKEVVVFLPNGGTHKELFVASAANRIGTPPQASIMMLGLASTSQYLKPLLDKLGLSLERFARGKFKTAAETMARDTMSDGQKEQVGALLGSIDTQLRDALKAREGLEDADIEEAFNQGFLRGQHAVDAKLIDFIAYEDQLPTQLSTPEKKASLLRANRYFAFHQKNFFFGMLPKPTLGIVRVAGTISGKSEQGIVQSLRLAAKNPQVLGVVLHVDSPGGSATSSDTIHREVVRLKEKKPVVVHFGNVAASGGYYIAAAADDIIAQPSTITGSIGVVSARLVAERFLNNLGVKTETIRKAKHADMFSPSRALAPSERKILEREMEGFYRSFVELVAEGRKMTHDAIHELAQGRVWAGNAAKDNGLVDTLGGLPVALETLRHKVRTIPKLGKLADVAVPRVVMSKPGMDLPPAALPAALAKLVKTTQAAQMMSDAHERIWFIDDLPDIQ